MMITLIIKNPISALIRLVFIWIWWRRRSNVWLWFL